MIASEAVTITHFEDRHRPACASLIHQLPDWFGIEAWNRAYIAALGRLPTFVVVNDTGRLLTPKHCVKNSATSTGSAAGAPWASRPLLVA